MTWAGGRGRGVAAAFAGALALGLVGAVDYVTGPLLPFFPFYLVLIVLLSLRTRWPAAMLFGLAAAAVLFAVDLASVPALRGTIYPYVRGAGHLLSFSLIGFTIPRLREEQRRLLDSQAALIRERGQLQDLNVTMVETIEETSERRYQALEALVTQQIIAVQELRETLMKLRR